MVLTKVNDMKKIFFLLTLVLSSFNGTEKNNLNVIDVMSSPKSRMTNLSDIATDIEYIPLQTTDICLIRRISSLKVIGNYIYIADGTVGKLFCFDRSGKYLFLLDNSGRGPEEYEYLTDFDVDTKNSMVAINCNNKILIFRQTEAGFRFLNKINLSYPPEIINFRGNSDDLLLQYSNTDGTKPFSRELINLKGETLISWPNHMKYQLQEKMIVMSRYETSSYSFKNELYLKEVGSDTIFKLSEMNRLVPVVAFDAKNKRVTPEVRSNVRNFADHMSDYFILQRIFGSERFFYYTYMYHNETHHEIIDQSTKARYWISGKEFLKDDLAGGVNFEPQYCNGGLFYSWVEANALKTFALSDQFKNALVKSPVKNAALKNLAEKVNLSDNSIVICAKIK
jgi:hypothetical protein